MSLLTNSRIRRFFNVYRPVFAFFASDGRIDHTTDQAAYLALPDDRKLGAAFYVRRQAGQSLASLTDTVARRISVAAAAEMAIAGETMADDRFVLQKHGGPNQLGNVIPVLPGLAYPRHRRRNIAYPLEVQFQGGGHGHKVVFNLAGPQLEEWWVDGNQLVNREGGYGRCIQTTLIAFETGVGGDGPYFHNPTMAGDYKGVANYSGADQERLCGSPLWRRRGPIVNADGSIDVLLLTNPAEFNDRTQGGPPGHDIDHGADVDEVCIYDSFVSGLGITFKAYGQPHIHRVTTWFYTPIQLSGVGGTPWSELALNCPILVLVQANNGSTAVIDELYGFDAAGAGTTLAFNGHAQLGHYAGEPPGSEYGGYFNSTNTFDGVLGGLGFSPVPSGQGGLIARRSVTNIGIGIYGVSEDVGGQITSWSWGRLRTAGTMGLDGGNYCVIGCEWSTNSSLRTTSTPLFLPSGWSTRTTHIVTGTLDEMRAAMLWLRANGLR